MATIDLTLFSPEYLAADRSQTLIDVAIVFMVLDTFFISLFFFSRYKCHIALSYDGWLMAPGYLLCLGHCIGDIRKPLNPISPISPYNNSIPLPKRSQLTYRRSPRQIRARRPARRNSKQSPDNLVAQTRRRRRLHLLPLDLLPETRLPVPLPQDLHHETLPLHDLRHDRRHRPQQRRTYHLLRRQLRELRL